MEYVDELKVLSEHMEKKGIKKFKGIKDKIVSARDGKGGSLDLLKHKLTNISSFLKSYLMRHSAKLGNFFALLCLMGMVSFLNRI